MLYLASQSPQRSALLSAANIAFTLVTSDADEDQIQLPHPQALAVERSLLKAQGALAAARELGATDSDIVLGADTVVSVQQTCLGKPTDDDDAKRMLRLLSQHTHTVTTAQVGLRLDGQQSIQVSLARVTMRAMSEDDIAAYLATGEHRGRAGAYAIQESGDRFVVDIEGEKDTIIGLNIRAVQTIMSELEDVT